MKDERRMKAEGGREAGSSAEAKTTLSKRSISAVAVFAVPSLVSARPAWVAGEDAGAAGEERNSQRRRSPYEAAHHRRDARRRRRRRRRVPCPGRQERRGRRDRQVALHTPWRTRHRSLCSAASPMELNPQQEAVADHFAGRILTLAGPGSGKTKTLTERTGRLIRKGVPAQSILCLTFTNKARDEMRERIGHVHGPLADNVFISNFHGLCGTVLRRLGGTLGYTQRMTVCDADDQIDLILQIARKRGMEP